MLWARCIQTKLLHPECNAAAAGRKFLHPLSFSKFLVCPPPTSDGKGYTPDSKGYKSDGGNTSDGGNGSAVEHACPAGAVFYVDLQCCVGQRRFPCFENCLRDSDDS